MMHKVFISYHHAYDQNYRNQLASFNEQHQIFIDQSVDTGDIDDSLSDDRIREIIRDDYLRDSTVTIVLVGTETKKRKHIDWEIYSSMFDGKINKKSGILAINLPSINCNLNTTAHDGEKETVFSDINDWIIIDSRSEYEERYPYMPARIVDNLLQKDAKISVVQWSRIINNPRNLSVMIDGAFKDKSDCNYDLSRPMRRSNS